MKYYKKMSSNYQSADYGGGGGGLCMFVCMYPLQEGQRSIFQYSVQ